MFLKFINVSSASYLGHRGAYAKTRLGKLPDLSRDSAKHKLVWLYARCSLGWRVHPKMTALDASGAKLQQKMDLLHNLSLKCCIFEINLEVTLA